MKYIFLLLCLVSLQAEENNSDRFDAQITVTTHVINLETGPLDYTATTAFCPIYNNTTLEAEIFFIAYTKDTKENRPITFVFPGGPGGAGTIASILSFGPRRLLTAAEGRSILPPYKIIDNPQTLLEFTDLVFVDPVDCGFSKIQEQANRFYYFSVEGDIQTLGEFIHTYIDLSERWDSPIYLAGGSYGTLRSCGLSHNLLQYGIAVTGLILDGCAFEFATHQSQRDHALPDCLLIPTFATTAWYHGRLWPEKTVEEVADQARKFTYEEYAPYMLQPSKLNKTEKSLFEQKLATFTGLSLETIRRFNCRINESIFTAEFFGSQRKVLGGLDSRYFGDISTIDPYHSHDPSYLDSFGYLPAFKSYLQKELETRLPFTRYVSFSSSANYDWNFNTFDSNGEPSFLQRLRHTLIFNPQMNVFVGSGYYDCRTPFAATEYCFEHLDLPASYTQNIQFEYYEAGHGILFDLPSLKKWKKDLTKFYGR